jgi:predicted DNA-binding antitoxin AbrB/MazE fold protein
MQLSYEEAVHKLLKVKINEGEEVRQVQLTVSVLTMC